MLAASARVQAQAHNVVTGELAAIDAIAITITVEEKRSGEQLIFRVDSETFITIAGHGPASFFPDVVEHGAGGRVVVIYDPGTNIAEAIHIAR